MPIFPKLKVASCKLVVVIRTWVLKHACLEWLDWVGEVLTEPFLNLLRVLLVEHAKRQLDVAVAMMACVA